MVDRHHCGSFFHRSGLTIRREESLINYARIKVGTTYSLFDPCSRKDANMEGRTFWVPPHKCEGADARAILQERKHPEGISSCNTVGLGKWISWSNSDRPQTFPWGAGQRALLDFLWWDHAAHRPGPHPTHAD